MDRLTAPRRQLVIAAVLVIIAGCTSGSAQWTFAPTPEPTEASASASASAPASGSPSASGNATATASGGTTGCAAGDKVIDIEETAQLKMNPASITASSGETVCFRVTNTAGFAHNFYVGPTSDIDTRNQSSAVKGIPDFTSGTQTLEYTFSGSGPFEFACWVAGHLEAGMKGAVTLR